MRTLTHLDPPVDDADLPKAIVHIAPSSKSAVRLRFWLLAIVVALLLCGAGYAGYTYRDRVKAFFQAPAVTATPTTEAVTTCGTGAISVAPGSPFESKLEYDHVARESIAAPEMIVSGSIIARLAPGSDNAEGRWDFANPEIALTYGDWIRARADVAFNEGQVERVRDLVKARMEQLTSEVVRLERLVEIGTEPGRDLVTARFVKAQAILQGSKDINEAVTAKNVAIRNRSLLERQLLQAGVDPEVMLKGKDGLVLIVAEVPEAKIGIVRMGQPCTATFYSYPGTPFHGRVGRLGPSVSQARRTLRVTFELEKGAENLLPGMYAEIGLGTNEREFYTVPSEAVLHIGKKDYVLIQTEPGRFESREVVVGEPTPNSPNGAGPKKDARIVVLSGLKHGERVVSSGAILLKPAVVKSLNGSTS